MQTAAVAGGAPRRGRHRRSIPPQLSPNPRLISSLLSVKSGDAKSALRNILLNGNPYQESRKIVAVQRCGALVQKEISMAKISGDIASNRSSSREEMTTMGSGRKTTPYALGVAIQVIYAATIVISKASFDQGLSVFVYILYRQAAACLLLLPVAIILERRNAPPMSFRLLLKMFFYSLVNTLGSCLYNISLKYTSSMAAAAICSSIPVITFFLALLLRMEAMKLKSLPGMAKAAGITLCLAGVLVIALYAGPSLRPLNRHGILAHNANKQVAAAHGAISKGLWIMWTFLIFLACVAWSVWFILQGLLLKEYLNKLLTALIPCFFGTIQSLVVAVAMEWGHGFSRWKLGLDLSLIAVAYSGIVGTGVCVYLQTWCVDMKGPVFLAMWNPLYLLLVLFCSSLLGETVRLGSVLGGILLVGGLYSVLWGKRKEETRLATSQDHHGEQSSKDNQLDAKESESTEPAKSDQQV